MNRKVEYARFHTELYAPGTLGAIGIVLPPTNKKIEGLEMMSQEDGLVITCTVLGEKELTVPWSNIALTIRDKQTAPAVILRKPQLKVASGG